MTSLQAEKTMTSSLGQTPMTSSQGETPMTSQGDKLMTSHDETSDDYQMSFSDLSKELQTELKDLIRWSKSTPEDFESGLNNFQIA
jgi:hypothetical protein